ncbi:MAG: hypothetical protein US18_C0003G0001, partial [Parcubacteria group bacterium GW2011_GWB1_36_5]
PNLPNPSRPPLVRGGQSIPPDKGEEKGVKGEEKEEKIKLGVGYDSTRTFLKENKKISDQILKEIRKKFAEEV